MQISNNIMEAILQKLFVFFFFFKSYYVVNIHFIRIHICDSTWKPLYKLTLYEAEIHLQYPPFTLLRSLPGPLRLSGIPVVWMDYLDSNQPELGWTLM